MAVKKIIIGIVLLLCVGIGVTVFTVLILNKTPRIYTLKTNPALPDRHWIQKDLKLAVDVAISEAKDLFPNNTPEQVTLEIMINKKILFKKDITFQGAHSSVQSFTFPIEIHTFTDGEYPLFLILKNTETQKIYKKISTLLVIDTTTPTLEEATAQKANVYRYVTDQDKTATQPALLGINLYSNTKTPISLTFILSEKGIFKTKISKEMAQVTEVKESTHEARIILTPIKNDWKAPYYFSDTAGNSIEGEIHFIFDATPPKLSGSTNYHVDKNSRDNVMFTFTSSEPLSYSKATVNGITKMGSGYGTNHAVKVPLTQDNNTVIITGHDLAGNIGTMQITAQVEEFRTFKTFEEMLKGVYGPQ